MNDDKPRYRMSMDREIFGPTGPTRPPRRIPVIVTSSTPEKARAWQVRLAAAGAPWIYRRGDVVSAGDLPAIACYIEDHDILMSWAEPARNPDEVRSSIAFRSRSREQWMATNEPVPQVERRHRLWDPAMSTLLDEGFQIMFRPADVNSLAFPDRDHHVDWRVIADKVAFIIKRECDGIGLL